VIIGINEENSLPCTCTCSSESLPCLPIKRGTSIWKISRIPTEEKEKAILLAEQAPAKFYQPR